MKINFSIQFNKANKDEVELYNISQTVYNITKDYIKLMSQYDSETQEMLEVLQECKEYSQLSFKEDENIITVEFNYNDEKEIDTTTSNCVGTIAQMAAELLSSRG